MSPRGKSGRIWRDIDRPHSVSALYVDDLFLQLSIPQTCPVVSPTDYPLAILRHTDGAQPHSCLLSDLSTIRELPSSNPTIAPAQKMFPVGVECDREHLFIATGVKDHRLVLLNHQHRSISSSSCYTPVFVDDILTNGTQSSASKSGRKRCFGLLVVRKFAL